MQLSTSNLFSFFFWISYRLLSVQFQRNEVIGSVESEQREVQAEVESDRHLFLSDGHRNHRIWQQDRHARYRLVGFLSKTSLRIPSLPMKVLLSSTLSRQSTLPNDTTNLTYQTVLPGLRFDKYLFTTTTLNRIYVPNQPFRLVYNE